MKRFYSSAGGFWLLALFLILANTDQASSQLQGGCFTILVDSISCGTPNGGAGYSYDLGIRTNLDMVVAEVDYSIISPANVSLSPDSARYNPALTAGDTARTVLSITGSGATAGTTVKILVRISNGAVRNNISCSDTVTVILPNCNTDCLSFIQDSLRCNDGPRGKNYIYSFGIINEGGLAIPGAELHYSVVSPGTVSVSPTYVALSNGLVSGDTLRDLSFTIDGIGATPETVVKVRVRLCNDGICCDDTVTLTLPTCRPDGCLEVVQESITCGKIQSHYNYSFTYKNRSNFVATMLEFKSNDVELKNARLAIGDVDLDELISEEIEMIVPTELQGKVVTFSAILTNEEGDSCTNTFVVRTPVCSWGCFSVTNSSITCLPPVNDMQVYGVQVTLHNESGASVRWLNVASLSPEVLAGSGWIDLGKEILPGDSIQIGPLPITGPTLQGGMTVGITVTLAGASRTETICTDTLRFVLPDCKPEFAGCMEFIDETLDCRTSTTGAPDLVWTFRVSNTSNRNLDSIAIVSVQSSNGKGVNVVPGTVHFGQPVLPGTVSAVVVTLSGPGVEDGEVISMVALGFFEDETCTLTHQLIVECNSVVENCFSLAEVSKTIPPTSPNRLDWRIAFTNSSDVAITGLIILPLTSGVQVGNSPYSIAPPLMSDSTREIVISLLNAPLGDTVGLVIGQLAGSSTNIVCSDTVEVVIPQSTNSVEERGSIDGLLLYDLFPNPASQWCSLRFRNAAPVRDLTLSIVDQTGREVGHPLTGASFETGDHLLTIETEGLPSGVYRVVLTVGDQRISRPLTVVR